MIIDDQFDLLALHKTIFSAKFADPPPLSEIPLSPIIAKLANQLVAELEERPETTGGEGWQEWRKAEKHEHLFEILVKNLIRDKNWSSLSEDEKRDRVVIGLAPLLAEDPTIDNLINQANQKTET